MSVLRNLESKLAGLVEGTFSRAFKSEVRPVEIARKLTREMEENTVQSLSRTYAPNEYAVWLSPEDRKQFEGYERDLATELSGYLLEHARRERIALVTSPQITFKTDDRLRLGEFGIQAQLVKPPARQGEEPSQGSPGQTMVYSAPPKQSRRERRQPTARLVETRAIVSLDDRRYVLDGPVASMGRSKECDCVLRDPNVSRRHAELRRGDNGDWQIVDLGSTNGGKVNGRQVETTRLSPGDDVVLGTARFTFDIEQA
jgi:Protein of unknown function (DUF3662)/FHA domain